MSENESAEVPIPPGKRRCPKCGNLVDAKRGVCPECQQMTTWFQIRFFGGCIGAVLGFIGLGILFIMALKGSS